MTTRRLTLAAAVALIGLAAAGCGGTTSSTPAGQAATTTSTASSTPAAAPVANYSTLKYIKGQLRAQLRRRLAKSANPSTRRYNVGPIDCSSLDRPHRWNCHVPLLSWDGSYLNQDVYYTVIARSNGSWQAKPG